MRREWQCPCGVWMSFVHGRHTHVKTRDMSMAEMIAARDGEGTEDLYGAPEITHEWWTPERPVREVPNG